MRIGVAACDPAGTMAFPVGVVPAGAQAYDRIAEFVRDYDPVEVVIGLPRSLSGAEGPAAALARAAAADLDRELARRGLARPVRLVDERLSTVTAAQRLRAGGRRAKRQREVIDAAAAVVILEHALASRDAGSGAGSGLGSAPAQASPPPTEETRP